MIFLGNKKTPFVYHRLLPWLFSQPTSPPKAAAFFG